MVRNLGVYFDTNLNFEFHAKKLLQSFFYQLRNISKVRRFLNFNYTEKLIHAFISSRLDYCNALFSSLNHHNLLCLQLVQNAAARLLTQKKLYHHITPVLASLHWLPVYFRIDFKILLLTYKALNGLAPLYLTELLKPYETGRCLMVFLLSNIQF